MSIQIPIAGHDIGEELACPACGGTYLHHVSVSIWSRDTEDSDGNLTNVGNGVKVSRVKADTIPGRRDAIRITFTCENGCDLRAIALQIMQHKGETYMAWVRTNKANTKRG